MATRVLALVLFCVVAIVAAPFAGAGLDGARGAFVFWQLRVPRVLVGVMVGGMLSIAGAVFQALFANPLATPSTVGTIAGATLGALAAVMFAPAVAGNMPAMVVGSFAGALAASLFVAAYAWRRRSSMGEVLLAGIAVTLATTALSTALQSAAEPGSVFLSAQWSLGHLSQIGYDGVWVLAPVVVLPSVVLLSLVRALQAIAIDEDMAHAQGVSVVRVRTIALVAASLGVAGCTAWCGPIMFVGLIVPHLIRGVVGHAQRLVLPLSLVGGAAFLVVCDAVARVVLPRQELPVGVVTSAVGAAMLLLLLGRRVDG